VIEHSLGRLGYRVVAMRHDELTRHDLMGLLAQRREILGSLAKRADERADLTEHVSVGDDSDQTPLVDDEKVMKPMFIEDLAKRGKLVVGTHRDDVAGHDVGDGRHERMLERILRPGYNPDMVAA
jgi:hypothetical protein